MTTTTTTTQRRKKSDDDERPKPRREVSAVVFAADATLLLMSMLPTRGLLSMRTIAFKERPRARVPFGKIGRKFWIKKEKLDENSPLLR
jgi:hypothetical protein